MFARVGVQSRCYRRVGGDIGGIYYVTVLYAAKSDISDCISRFVVFSMDTAGNIDAFRQCNRVNANQIGIIGGSCRQFVNFAVLISVMPARVRNFKRVAARSGYFFASIKNRAVFYRYLRAVNVNHRRNLLNRQAVFQAADYKVISLGSFSRVNYRAVVDFRAGRIPTLIRKTTFCRRPTFLPGR